MGARDEAWTAMAAERLTYESGSDRSGALRRAITPDMTPAETPVQWLVMLTGVYQTQPGATQYGTGSWVLELNPGATRYGLLQQCKKDVAAGAGIGPDQLAVTFFSCERNELT